mgnify:FL=1
MGIYTWPAADELAAEAGAHDSWINGASDRADTVNVPKPSSRADLFADSEFEDVEVDEFGEL